jgi:hypothetical protein
MRPLAPFEGPSSLTVGPDGNVWYATGATFSRPHPNPATTAAIGRIAASGEITEFRAGLRSTSFPDNLVAGAGGVWFIDRETNSIGRIRPSSAPANTFLVLAPRASRRLPGVTNLPVVVPGPGTLRLKQVSPDPRRRAVTVRASSCGRTIVRFRPSPVARRKLARRGRVSLRLRIAFTPEGGSPYRRVRTIVLRNG